MSKRFITFETVSEPIDPDMEQLTVKPLFARIVEGLKHKGADVTQSPEQWDSYGWYADFQVRSARLTCMMQRSDSWLLLVSDNRTFMDRLKGRKHETEMTEFADLLVSLIQESFDVPVQRFDSEAEFRAG